LLERNENAPMSEKDDEIARDDIVEELLALLDPTLDAEALRRGLLDYGLFAEKLPPAFSSVEIPETLVESVERVLDETDEKALRKGLGDRSHDFARYESLKPTNISRALGIPHPEAHILQVASLAKHWGEIRTHVETPDPQFSRIHLRRLNNSPRLFEMNYKGDERYQHEEDELGWMAEARFVVHTDISACFPSIYTHSIPWALHGKAVAKADHGVTSLFGNLLDATARGIRDTQTNGLLIGPHSSNLLSEIVLTVVDQKLVDKGYLRVSRHIDDYRYFAASYGDAERFCVTWASNFVSSS